MDGFSVFVGVIWSVIFAMVIWIAAGMASYETKLNAVRLGYFEVGGNYFSVKPATTIRAE